MSHVREKTFCPRDTAPLIIKGTNYITFLKLKNGYGTTCHT